jgi:hypothetical protein
MQSTANVRRPVRHIPLLAADAHITQPVAGKLRRDVITMSISPGDGLTAADHEFATAEQTEDKIRRADGRRNLFDQPQQGLPPLSRLDLGVTKPLWIVGVQHLVAKGLQIIIVDVIELHAKLEHGNRYQLRRLLVAGRQQRSPALLQGS